MPMERAVPATWRLAASRSLALRSGILVRAISATWASVTVPPLSLPGAVEPLSTPAAARSSVGVGGVLVMNVNERSSNTVISAGTMLPVCDSVAALYCLQNSMMFTPCGPRAVPTGGAGVAFPAGIWILTTAATRRFAIRCLLQLRDLGEFPLDGRLAAEDVHEALELAVVLVDVGVRTGHPRG